MKTVLVISLLITAAIAFPTADLDIPFAIQNRISGGDPAKPAEFPFQVGVQTRRRNEEYEYNAWCGGSLISDQLVLTAAHCLYNGISAEIFLGATDLSANEPGRIIINVPKENFVVHENYTPNLIRNDIALVKLPQKVTLNKYIQTVNLPRKSQKDETFAKTVGWISGWGRTGEGKGSTQQLQYTRRWILPNEYCDYDYGSFFQKETQVCVDGSHGMASCQGDSGGPLTIEEEDGSRTLVGATSYGRIQCGTGTPTVYTRVTAFLDWIAENGGISLRE